MTTNGLKSRTVSYILFGWHTLAEFFKFFEASKTEALDKEAFDLLLGPLEDILARKETNSGGKAPVAPPAGAIHGGRDPNKPKLLGKEVERL